MTRLRALMRPILLLLAPLLLGLGAVGVAHLWLPGVPLVVQLHALAAALVTGLGGAAGISGAGDLLLGGPLAYGLLAVGAITLFLGLRGRRGEAEPEVAEDGRPEAPVVDKKTRRRVEKQADGLAKKGSLAEAAQLLIEGGSLDRAAELFIKAELYHRAAEIRHDQNRFAESAELYQRAGKFDTAGTILATQSDFAGAAECYAKANRLSVAAEMFEKAENHLRAGECYAAVGFQRHAAQSFVKCQAWGKAASALEEVILEEFARSSTGQDPKKQRELRTLVLQAGKLWEQAGNLEKALAALERGNCFAQAAEVALRLERFAVAAELYQRGHDPMHAAEALQRLGEHGEAARLLGEYHRDRGEDEEAAACFEQAGEHSAAGDLFRKLERYAEAAGCYERQGDASLAAEMFRLAGDTARAAGMYEKAGRFEDAAECFHAVGDVAKEAELLARASRLLRAGELYHGLGRDDDAIKLFQKVEPGTADFGPASALLGAIFRAKGMHSLAVKKLQQAIGSAELSRETVQAYYALAEVHELNGELREAVDLFEKILAFDYHFGDVEQRLAAARAKAASLAASEPSLAGSTNDRPSGSPGQPARYQIVGELGRGGMGIVHKAKDTILDRVVAFKVLPDALKENPQALKNFLREAKSAAQLNHPNIVTVYDAGEQDGRYYIAMEYVDGTTLKEILRRRSVIAASGVLHVLVQMCEALAYAHDKKIVHRDIKTANTMWTGDKKAKIMDFGLAKVVEEVRNHTTLVSGTPYYMSPEQTLGRNVDHRTDIYSLGVTIYELATGSLPFKDGNVPYHHVHTPAPDPRSVNPRLPLPLVQIISRCLQKDPADRYQSTREILAELRAAVSQGGLGARTT